MLLSTLAGLAAGLYCIKTAKEIGLGGIYRAAKDTVVDAGVNLHTQKERCKTEKADASAEDILQKILNKATSEEKVVLHEILNRNDDTMPPEGRDRGGG